MFGDSYSIQWGKIADLVGAYAEKHKRGYQSAWGLLIDAHYRATGCDIYLAQEKSMDEDAHADLSLVVRRLGHIDRLLNTAKELFIN